MKELTIDEKFGLLLESIGKIETDIAGIKNSIGKIESDIVDIKQVQVNQHEMITRQNQIIELLSARSIALESDLKQQGKRKGKGIS
jgi:hypothetical protein